MSEHTEQTRTEFERASETNRDAMADVDHTSPYTDRPFGESVAFQRGATVAADGGERDAVPRSSSDRRSDGGRDTETDAETAETVADVDHEHPHADANDANRVFERGTEGRDETV